MAETASTLLQTVMWLWQTARAFCFCMRRNKYARSTSQNLRAGRHPIALVDFETAMRSVVQQCNTT
uniref:Uncharacterized protein n=1 Tax=viral metagenome TaxID=1070528 RepID=A0A6C0C1V5_9ZZZZ